jgi:hypothetical protein
MTKYPVHGLLAFFIALGAYAQGYWWVSGFGVGSGICMTLNWIGDHLPKRNPHV